MNIDDIRQRNQYFFEPATMRFFNCRLSQAVYGTYFVTSERFDANTPRRYTVRRIGANGSIDTVGEFQQYATLRQAKAAARALAAGERRGKGRKGTCGRHQWVVDAALE